MSALARHIFRAVSYKATRMLQRQLRRRRFSNMNRADRETQVQKMATEIVDKIEARLIAWGPCYHPKQTQPLRLWDSLRHRARDRGFLDAFGHTIQSPSNPILNKTEIVIVYFSTCRFRFQPDDVVDFVSLKDEQQKRIISA